MVGEVAPAFTAEDKLREVEIEIGFRRGVYKRQVGYGKMRQEDADRRIGVMKAIALDYARLAAGFKAVTEETIADAMREADPSIEYTRFAAEAVMKLLRAKGILPAA